MALLPRKEAPALEAPQVITPAPEPQTDKTATKLREAQAARKAAEQRADELAKQLTTATMEIMRLKAEIYDLSHGLA